MRIVLLRIILLLSLAFPSYSAIVYVNINSACSVCDGTSWGLGYKDLQVALSSVTAGDSIWIAAGTYHPSVSDRSVSFEINSGFKIFGGFAGTETLFSQRDYLTNFSVLSGDLSDNDNAVLDTNEVTRQENSIHVITISGAVSNQTILDGIYVSGGNAYAYSSGGLYPGGGMGIYNQSAAPVIRNCFFQDNISTFGGGAVETYGQALFQSCVFTNNITQAVSNGGGAVKNSSNSATIFRDCIFENNSATGNGAGGAVQIQNNSNPRFFNCRFSNNFTSGSFTEGGAVYIVSSNNAAFAEFTNCIFDNNSAANGGAVNMWGSVADFYSCTFYANSTNAFHISNGGGISRRPVVYNSILYGNSGQENNTATYAPDYYSCLLQSSNCVGNSCNCCIFNLDPLFVNPSTKNFRLNNFSPACNSGNQAYVSEITDFYGSSRKVFQVDIGAAESSFSLNAETSMSVNDSSELIFNGTQLGDTLIQSLVVINSGSSPLIICGFSITGDFSYVLPTDLVIQASDTTEITLRAHASSLGVNKGVFTILNNDLDESDYQVLLKEIITEPSTGEVVIYEGVSPNGDGKNDYLRIENIENYPQNELIIYDRMGTIVAKISGYTNEKNNWNGNYQDGNNQRVVNGTYYYVLKLDEETKPIKGFLLLQD